MSRRSCSIWRFVYLPVLIWYNRLMTNTQTKWKCHKEGCNNPATTPYQHKIGKRGRPVQLNGKTLHAHIRSRVIQGLGKMCGDCLSVTNLRTDLNTVPVGTVKVNKDGYAWVRTATQEHGQGWWYPHHRKVMEDVLGRKLIKGESVHHKNGIKHDNRPENLELWIGNVRYGQRAADVVCPKCKVSYWDAL